MAAWREGEPTRRPKLAAISRASASGRLFADARSNRFEIVQRVIQLLIRLVRSSHWPISHLGPAGVRHGPLSIVESP